MLNTVNFRNRFKVVVPLYEAPFFETELKKKGISFQVENNSKKRNSKITYTVEVQHKKTVESSLKSTGIHYNLDVFPIFVNMEEKKTVSLYIKFVAVFAILMLGLKLIKSYYIP